MYVPQFLAGALFEGRLTLDGQCLFLETTGGTIYGIAWPADRTRLDAGDRRLVVGDMAAPIGTNVEIGAAIADLDDDRAAGFVVEPRPECRGDSFLLAEGFISVEDDR